MVSHSQSTAPRDPKLATLLTAPRVALPWAACRRELMALCLLADNTAISPLSSSPHWWHCRCVGASWLVPSLCKLERLQKASHPGIPLRTKTLFRGVQQLTVTLHSGCLGPGCPWQGERLGLPPAHRGGERWLTRVPCCPDPVAEVSEQKLSVRSCSTASQSRLSPGAGKCPGKAVPQLSCCNLELRDGFYLS